MDSLVVQICGLGLVLLSLGNIYQIVSKSRRPKVWVPRKLDAGVIDISEKRPVQLRRAIDVDVVEVGKGSQVLRLPPARKSFDELYSAGKRRGF